jgi:hypothetical protein
LSAGRIYVRTLRTYAAHAGSLLLLGALVFVPLGLLNALADRAGGFQASDLGALATIGFLAAFLAQAGTALIGEVFYSGVVALTLAGPEATRPSLIGVARSLSYGRLIAVDVLFVAVTAFGLTLLVVPGVVFFTWFALAGPLVEIEGDGVRTAFKQSRALVRGRFWTVLGVLGPITLASEAIADAALPAAHALLGNQFLSDWLGESAANVLLSPLYAVAAVLITLGLSGRD